MYCTILCTKEEGCIGTKAEKGSCHLYKDAFGGLEIDESSKISSGVWLRCAYRSSCSFWISCPLDDFVLIPWGSGIHNVNCRTGRKKILLLRLNISRWAWYSLYIFIFCVCTDTLKGKYIFKSNITSLTNGESYDGWSKQGDFSDDPSSNLYSVLHKMEQFREIVEKVCQTQMQAE